MTLKNLFIFSMATLVLVGAANRVFATERLTVDQTSVLVAIDEDARTEYRAHPSWGNAETYVRKALIPMTNILLENFSWPSRLELTRVVNLHSHYPQEVQYDVKDLGQSLKAPEGGFILLFTGTSMSERGVQAQRDRIFDGTKGVVIKLPIQGTFDDDSEEDLSYVHTLYELVRPPK